MHVVRVEIDSDAYGRNFLDIKDFSTDVNFGKFEEEYIRQYDPFYVSCKVHLEDIREIQALGHLGFEFIEFQIREQLNLKKTYPVFKPYKMEVVSSNEDLQEVLAIAAETFEHDRFTADPLMQNTFSGERYKAYVMKSFNAEDEFLYKLFNSETGEILGFKTHKIINNEEALMFLGGVLNKYKNSPIPVINGYLELNELKEKGIKKVITHISGGNYGVLNLEVKEIGYKVVNSFVVLRKIYAGRQV